MTLYEFLRATEIDVRNIDNKLGNDLDAQLAHNNVKIDFDKDINQVTDEELYQIGRIIILYHQRSGHYFREEFIDLMKVKIAEVKERNKNNVA